MNNEESSIENRLKDFRKKHNLSQEELAEKLGITRQSIIALEQGKSLPSLPLAVSMCQFFHSAFEDLFAFSREIEQEVDKIFDESNANIININAEPLIPAGHHSSPDGLRTAKENTMGNELEPWRPFREAVSLRDAMDRLFEDSVITPRGLSAMPRIDIKDKKDSIEVNAELPGLTEDEINVEISDGVMTISGEVKKEEEKEDEGYYYKESHSGSFSRSFTLPADVQEDKATAEMEKGILKVSIPKIAPKKATKVTVSKGKSQKAK